MIKVLFFWLIILTSSLAETCNQINDEFIPQVIDINLFRNGNEFEKNLIIDLFDKSLRKTGLLRLVNHGIPHQIINDSYNAALEFFKDSVSEKNKYPLVNGTKCGYKGTNSFYAEKISGPLDEELDNFAHRDELPDGEYTETYWFNLDRDESFNSVYPRKSDQSKNKNSFINDELWNGGGNYINEIPKLWKTINKLASLSLKCSDNIFDNLIQNAQQFYSLFVYLYYPSRILKEKEEEYANTYVNLGGHTDWMTWTFVKNDDVDGLQVNINDKWYNVKNYNDDSLLLFTGDLIKIMTNNYWTSTWHRVIGNKNNKERLTMSYFSGSDYDQLIKTENCKNIDQNSGYSQNTITVRDYYNDKFAGLSGAK